MLCPQVDSCLQNIDLKELKQQTLSSNNLVIIMKKKSSKDKFSYAWYTFSPYFF